MATIIKSNSKKGSQATVGFIKKNPQEQLGDGIPTNSPKTIVSIKPTPYRGVAK